MHLVPEGENTARRHTHGDTGGLLWGVGGADRSGVPASPFLGFASSTPHVGLGVRKLRPL